MSESSNSKDKIVSESGSDSPKQEEKAAQEGTEQHAPVAAQPVHGTTEQVNPTVEESPGETQAEESGPAPPRLQPEPPLTHDEMVYQTRVIANWTRVLGGVAVLSAIISFLQFCAIQSTIKQNQDMLGYAGRQANAAGDQVNAMGGQLNTMKDQANTMRNQTR